MEDKVTELNKAIADAIKDGVLTEAEVNEVTKLARKVGMTRSEQVETMLKARLEKAKNNNPIVQGVSSEESQSPKFSLEQMIDVALADGVLTDEEIAEVVQAARAVGFTRPNQVETMLKARLALKNQQGK